MGQNLGNVYRNQGFCSTTAKNKYYGKNLPSLPLGTLGGKKIYKWSEASGSSHGKATAYGLYSNQGSVRPYNEDRVYAYHTQLKSEAGYDVQFSFFAVYDGHGGQSCSKYLSKELHLALIDEPLLIKNPVAALRKHILDLDSKFLNFYLENPSNTEYQRAGSCLNVVVIIEDMWYVANVGDWRSILSTKGGQTIYQLSKDHKPSDPSERDRVIDSGGKIYVSAIKQTKGIAGTSLQRTDRLITKTDSLQSSTENAINIIENGGEAYGPHRVLPGRLSVSRAIGDAHAKLKQLGGNPSIVIGKPDIK